MKVSAEIAKFCFKMGIDPSKAPAEDFTEKDFGAVTEYWHKDTLILSVDNTGHIELEYSI